VWTGYYGEVGLDSDSDTCSTGAYSFQKPVREIAYSSYCAWKFCYKLSAWQHRSTVFLNIIKACKVKVCVRVITWNVWFCFYLKCIKICSMAGLCQDPLQELTSLPSSSRIKGLSIQQQQRMAMHYTRGQRSWPAISSCYQSIETTLFVNGVNWPHRTKVLTRKFPFPARSSVSSSLPGRTPLYDRRRHGKVPADRPNGFYLSVETEACRSAWATTPVAGQASRASISTTMGMTPPSDWCMGRQQRVWNSRTR